MKGNFQKIEYEGKFEYDIRNEKDFYRKKEEFSYDGIWNNNIPNGNGKIFIDDNIFKYNFHNRKLISDLIFEKDLYDRNIDYDFI